MLSLFSIEAILQGIEPDKSPNDLIRKDILNCLDSTLLQKGKTSSNYLITPDFERILSRLKWQYFRELRNYRDIDSLLGVFWAVKIGENGLFLDILWKKSPENGKFYPFPTAFSEKIAPKSLFWAKKIGILVSYSEISPRVVFEPSALFNRVTYKFKSPELALAVSKYVL